MLYDIAVKVSCTGANSDGITKLNLQQGTQMATRVSLLEHMTSS